MNGSEVVGLGGAFLAGYVYLPQITHLIRERCSAGLSERAFALWLVASLLMTVHAVSIGAVVFVVLGFLQVGATSLIAFYCRRYRGLACPSHAPAVVLAQPEPPEPAPEPARPAPVLPASAGVFVLDGQIGGD